MEANPKPLVKPSLRRNFFLVAFSVLVIALVLALTIVFSVRTKYLNQQTGKANTLQTASWKVDSVAPSNNGDGTLTITVQSSIGNIRRYTGVKSYGISNSGDTLALSTDSNFRFIDLATDESTEIGFSFSYSGDFGQAITWSPTDEEVAMIIQKTSSGDLPVLLVIDTEGNILSETTDNFSYEEVAGRKQFSPAKFSPTAAQILTKTFENEGNKNDLDPVNLKVFNLAGTLRKLIPVRDSVKKADQIIYTWNQDGDSVLHLVTQQGQQVNYAQEFQFTKTLVGF